MSPLVDDTHQGPRVAPLPRAQRRANARYGLGFALSVLSQGLGRTEPPSALQQDDVGVRATCPGRIRQDSTMTGGPYDALAGEYYDRSHKTSRNFDHTTREVVDAWRDRVPEGLVLEVGCGRGRSGEFLGVEPERVVQLDNSRAMLDLVDRERAAVRIVHDAESLPFPDGEFGAVTAFLCDAFLGLNFLCEARRVLRPGGVLCGTTPSFEWGSSLREHLSLDLMTTRFLLRGGAEVRVPSLLYPAAQLREMLIHAGSKVRSTLCLTACPPTRT